MSKALLSSSIRSFVHFQRLVPWYISLRKDKNVHNKKINSGETIFNNLFRKESFNINTMANEDTIKLLQECNAGIKMGVSSIDEILDEASNQNLMEMLIAAKLEHQRLGSETHRLLNQYGDSGKDPNPMAKTMSWIKTNVMMAVDAGDNTIADLMTDGCNMGVKSLSRYLNQYDHADNSARKIARELITCESDLSSKLRQFL